MGFFDFLKPSEQKKKADAAYDASAHDTGRLDEAREEVAQDVADAVMGNDSDSSDSGGDSGGD